MSTIRADNVAPSAGGTPRNLPRGVAAAWANLNGTGTIAGRDSVNMASYTDNGTGDYTFNLTAAMSNGNYSISGSQRISGNNRNIFSVYGSVTPTASLFRIWCGDASAFDADYVMPQAFGSLA